MPTTPCQVNTSAFKTNISWRISYKNYIAEMQRYSRAEIAKGRIVEGVKANQAGTLCDVYSAFQETGTRCQS